MPGFSVPEVDANPDGWGPTTVPEQLDGVPYAPFGKGDKIGRVSDFTNSGFNKYGGALLGISVYKTPTPHRSRIRPSLPRCLCALTCAQVGASSRTASRVSRCSTSSRTMRCADRPVLRLSMFRKLTLCQPASAVPLWPMSADGADGAVLSERAQPAR